ncbi:MAG: hypothetical protein HC822_18370 [Oscillochloris sp.]|nr:hypothetical protein [Oscillochloris sp.]
MAALVRPVRIGLLSLLLFVLLASVPAMVRAESAQLTLTPDAAPQNSTVTVTLSGFAGGEPVTLWLTLPDYRVIGLGDVTADRQGAAAVDFTVGVDVPVGRHMFSARGNLSGATATAAFDLTPAPGASSSPGVSLIADAAVSPQGTCFLFAGAGYGGNEPIAVWLNLPDGTVSNEGLSDDVRTDAQGAFGYRICFGSDSAQGTYAFTAYGRASGLTGIAEFTLERGDYLAAPSGDAVLFVDPPQARQLELVTLVGGGFEPGERVSLWLTLPNGVVVDLFSGRTEDGTFAVDLELPAALPAGTHIVSAYGQTSGVRATAPLELLPGDGA